VQCEPCHTYSTLRPYPGLIATAFASKVYWLVSRSWHCMWLSSFRQLSIYALTLGIDYSLHQVWHSRFWIWHQSLEVRGSHIFVRKYTANVTCCACEHGRTQAAFCFAKSLNRYLLLQLGSSDLSAALAPDSNVTFFCSGHILA
jgi:hypothetical protein